MYNRAYIRLLCLLALLFFVATQSHSVLAVEAFSDAQLRDFGLYSDLVVTGRITNYGYIKIPGNRLLGSVDSDGMTAAIRVTIAVSSVLAGDYSELTLSFIIPEGEIGPRIDGIDVALQKLRIGDPLVAVLNYDIYNNGLYVITTGPSLLRIEGDKLVPYVDGYVIESQDPLRILQEASAKRNFRMIASGAEIVCVATLIHDDTQSCTLTLEIDSVLKGSIRSKRISLDYLHDFAMWSGLGPKLLLFLKPRNGAYVLSAGMNSVYTLNGDRILRNRLPLNATLLKVREIVQMSKEIHQ